jgi:hypothetical protein
LKLFLQILKLQQYTKLPFILQKEFLRFHEGSLERNKASMESQEPSVLQGWVAGTLLYTGEIHINDGGDSYYLYVKSVFWTPSP